MSDEMTREEKRANKVRSLYQPTKYTQTYEPKLLCWFWNSYQPNKKVIRMYKGTVIPQRKYDDRTPFLDWESKRWEHCQPLTTREIDIFMGLAAEEEVKNIK